MLSECLIHRQSVREKGRVEMVRESTQNMACSMGHREMTKLTVPRVCTEGLGSKEVVAQALTEKNIAN